MGVIFLCALASVTPQAETSRLQLDLEGDIGYQPAALLGGATLSLTIFAPAPVADDDAPYLLQPFLQRAGRVWVTALAGGALALGTATTDRSANGGAQAGFDLYVHRWVALDASFAVDGDSNDTIGLHGTIGAAVRWRDLRFDLGYRIDGLRLLPDLWTPVFYAHVTTSVEAVVKRRVELLLSLDVLDHGAAVWGSVAGYPLKSVGIFGGIGGSKSGSDSLILTSHVTGRIGVSWWKSRRFGVLFSYTVIWTSRGASGAAFLPASAFVEHLVSLSFSSRP